MNYFDRSLGELSLSEIAYLAALPKAPNRYSIVKNEKEAYARRDYVLGRMKDDGYITVAEEQAAKAERLTLRKRSATETAQADFFSEEVRRNLLAAYGEQGLYEGGLTVSTTLDPAIQKASDNALREGLIAYDRRHGWRGPYAKIADMKEGSWEEEFARIQQRRPMYGPDGLAPRRRHEGGGNPGADRWIARRGWRHRRRDPVRRDAMGLRHRPQPDRGRVPQPAGQCGERRRRDRGREGREERRRQAAYPAGTFGLRQIPNANGGVVVMRIRATAASWR